MCAAAEKANLSAEIRARSGLFAAAVLRLAVGGRKEEEGNPGEPGPPAGRAPSAGVPTRGTITAQLRPAANRKAQQPLSALERGHDGAGPGQKREKGALLLRLSQGFSPAPEPPPLPRSRCLWLPGPLRWPRLPSCPSETNLSLPLSLCAGAGVEWRLERLQCGGKRNGGASERAVVAVAPASGRVVHCAALRAARSSSRQSPVSRGLRVVRRGRHGTVVVGGWVVVTVARYKERGGDHGSTHEVELNTHPTDTQTLDRSRGSTTTSTAVPGQSLSTTQGFLIYSDRSCPGDGDDGRTDGDAASDWHPVTTARNAAPAALHSTCRHPAFPFSLFFNHPAVLQRWSHVRGVGSRAALQQPSGSA
nr:unnamed protein product [Digitaria exilis]